MASFGRFSTTRQQRRETAGLLAGKEMTGRHSNRPPPSDATLESGPTASDANRESAWPIMRAAGTLVISLVVLVISIVLARHNVRSVRSLTTAGCHDFERHFCPESAASAVAQPPSSTPPACPTPPDERWPITVRGGNRTTRHRRPLNPSSRRVGAVNSSNTTNTITQPSSIHIPALPTIGADQPSTHIPAVKTLLDTKMWRLRWKDSSCTTLSAYEALLHIHSNPNETDVTTMLSFEMLVITQHDGDPPRILETVLHKWQRNEYSSIGTANKVVALVAGDLLVEQDKNNGITLTASPSFELPLAAGDKDACAPVVQSVPFVVTPSTIAQPSDTCPIATIGSSTSSDSADAQWLMLGMSFVNGHYNLDTKEGNHPGNNDDRWANFVNWPDNANAMKKYQLQLVVTPNEDSSGETRAWSMRVTTEGGQGATESSVSVTELQLDLHFYAKAVTAESNSAAFGMGGDEFMYIHWKSNTEGSLLTFGLLGMCPTDTAPLKVVPTSSPASGQKDMKYYATNNHPEEIMNIYRVEDTSSAGVGLSSSGGEFKVTKTGDFNTLPGLTMVPLFFLVYAYACTQPDMYIWDYIGVQNSWLFGCYTFGHSYDIVTAANAWWVQSALSSIYTGTQQTGTTSDALGRSFTPYFSELAKSHTGEAEWSVVVKTAIEYFKVKPCSYSIEDDTTPVEACLLFHNEHSGRPESCS